MSFYQSFQLVWDNPEDVEDPEYDPSLDKLDSESDLEPDEDKKLYQCNRCSYNSTNLSTLKRHKLIHDKKKSFVCKICKKSFIDKSKLNQHLVTHPGVTLQE